MIDMVNFPETKKIRLTDKKRAVKWVEMIEMAICPVISKNAN